MNDIFNAQPFFRKREGGRGNFKPRFDRIRFVVPKAKRNVVLFEGNSFKRFSRLYNRADASEFEKAERFPLHAVCIYVPNVLFVHEKVRFNFTLRMFSLARNVVDKERLLFVDGVVYEGKFVGKLVRIPPRTAIDENVSGNTQIFFILFPLRGNFFNGGKKRVVRLLFLHRKHGAKRFVVFAGRQKSRGKFEGVRDRNPTVLSARNVDRDSGNGNVVHVSVYGADGNVVLFREIPRAHSSTGKKGEQNSKNNFRFHKKPPILQKYFNKYDSSCQVSFAIIFSNRRKGK